MTNPHILLTRENGQYRVRVYNSVATAVRAAWKVQKERKTTLLGLYLEHPFTDPLTTEDVKHDDVDQDYNGHIRKTNNVS